MTQNQKPSHHKCFWKSPRQIHHTLTSFSTKHNRRLLSVLKTGVTGLLLLRRLLLVVLMLLVLMLLVVLTRIVTLLSSLLVFIVSLNGIGENTIHIRNTSRAVQNARRGTRLDIKTKLKKKEENKSRVMCIIVVNLFTRPNYDVFLRLLIYKAHFLGRERSVLSFLLGLSRFTLLTYINVVNAMTNRDGGHLCENVNTRMEKVRVKLTKIRLTTLVDFAFVNDLFRKNY